MLLLLRHTVWAKVRWLSAKLVKVHCVHKTQRLVGYLSLKIRCLV